MLHAGSSIPGFALSNPFQQHLSPSLFSDLIAWYQRTTVVAFWPEREQLHLNFGSFFPPNSWKGEDSAAWFWTVSFAWALSLMSTVTACDKMADSICDRPDHKYTTQLQWFTIATKKSTFSSWSGPKKVAEKIWSSGGFKIQNVAFQHCGSYILSEERSCLLSHCWVLIFKWHDWLENCWCNSNVQ